jgi:hypothetical protein
VSPLGKSLLTLSILYLLRVANGTRGLGGLRSPRQYRISEDYFFGELVAYIVGRSCHLPTFWVLIKAGVGDERTVALPVLG